MIGVPSELTEEEVLAIVVPKPGSELTPEALLDHCQDRMAHFAVPRYVRFADALPKNRRSGSRSSACARSASPAPGTATQHGYEVRR